MIKNSPIKDKDFKPVSIHQIEKHTGEIRNHVVDFTDNMNTTKEKNEARIEMIKQQVSSFFGMEMSDFDTRDRHSIYVKIRHVAIYFINKMYPSISLSYLGQQMNHHHATVIHAVKTIQNRIDTDVEFNHEMQKLADIINLSKGLPRKKLWESKDYFFVDLDEVHVIKLTDKKSITFSGIDRKDIDKFMKKSFNLTVEPRYFTNTGLYILKNK